jgi:hypothetical protein
MSQPPVQTQRPAPPAGPDAGRDARRRAAVLLEVLAGGRTPVQAAQALGLSLPRYYQLEAAALRGLVGACEPRPRGRARPAEAELADLRRELQRLQRELARQQGLVRLTQRAVGLPPPAPPAGKGRAGGRKARRPAARALRAAARLQGPEAGPAADTPAAGEGPP